VRVIYPYRKLRKALLLICLFIGFAARAEQPASSYPFTTLLLSVSVQMDSVSNPPAEGFDAFRKKVAETFDQIRQALGEYRPGGRANPVSQELLRVVFYFMASFVACIFLMLIVIIVSRVRREQSAKRKALLKEKYENILVELLYTHESEPDAAYLLKPAEELRAENDAELNDMQSAIAPAEASATQPESTQYASYFEARELRRRFNREVLIEQIIELHKNLSGATSQVLRELYLELGFDQDAKKRLKHFDWSVKAKAVRELAQMGIAEAEPEIARLLNHTNSVLVLEVQIALLKLNREHPFSFLNETEVEITEWQQVSMLAMISHSPHFKIPDFSQWLSSNNDSVVLFVTKMINYYNQLEAADQLIGLLSHPNEKVRTEVIRTLGDMEVMEADQALIEIYPKETEETQKEILETLGKIGTDNSVAFLYTALNSPQFPLAFMAAKGLMKLGRSGEEVLAQAKNEELSMPQIVKHLADERI
jgi:HEAT repeat protein